MHNFNTKRSKKPTSMEGFFVNRPRRPAIPKKEDPSVEGQINRPQGNWLDDFDKPEGFRGRALPELNTIGQYEQATAEKKRWFRRKKNQAGEQGKQKRPKKPRKLVYKVLFRSLLIVAVAVILVGGYLFGKAWWTAHNVFKGGGSSLAWQENVDPYMLNGEGDGRVNILLLGRGGANQLSGPDLTDSIMIASLDPINDGVVLLSVPRDLWVDPEGLWPMKINAVYAQTKYKTLNANPDNEAAAEAAGLTKINQVIEEYLGVHMHYYAIIDYSAFEDAVNIIGGITITLPEDYYDGTMLVGSEYLYLPAGPNDLDGGYALAYARSRYGTTRGDFDRGQHQQTVLVAIKDKILSIGTYSNPIKVSQLLDAFGDRVQTNLSIDDFMRVYDFAKEVDSNNISHIDLAQQDNAVVRTGNVDGLSVVYPKAGVDNYDGVRAFVRTSLKDGYLIQEDPSIIVLNGTTQTGLAEAKAEELRGYGYNVLKVADSPVSVTVNQVIDTTGGAKKYTKRYLEQRFGVTATDYVDGLDLSAHQADFIIIVGP